MSVMKANEGPRQDVLALGAALLFSVVATLVIWLLGDRLTAHPLGPDLGASWYRWQSIEPTSAARASAWLLYLAHQFGMWWIIWRAKSERPGHTTNLHRFNVYALLFNGAFVVVHIVQTHVFYDALAIDVSIWSALGSVAIMLIWVLLMESPRRGIVFGKGPGLGGGGLTAAVLRAAKKHHAWFFSWAIIYTFWYHPTESTFGHLLGFSYIFVLLIQGSLMFTRVHIHRWWTLGLEMWVLVHGVSVAMSEQGLTMAMMFFFGFASIFIVTQMHGLGLSRLVRALLGAVFVGTIAVASVMESSAVLLLVPRIAVIDYLGVLVLFGLLALYVKLRGGGADGER